MSDKFFFKGRQAARQDHTNHGYQPNGKQKTGSKKYPLKLVVDSEERKHEVEAIVVDAGLYAEINVDTTEDAVESIGELTLLLNKSGTVRRDDMPARNDPCHCGSGEKYKKCCA